MMSRKVVKGIFLLNLTACLVSCGHAETTQNASKDDSKRLTTNSLSQLIDYDAKKDDLKMRCFGYYPSDKPSDFERYDDLHVTDLLLTRDYEYMNNPDAVKKTLKMAETYVPAIQCFPFSGHQVSADSILTAPYLSDGSYSNIAGIYMYDEPFPSNLSDLANRVPTFEKIFPGKEFLVDLLMDEVSNARWDPNVSWDQYSDNFFENIIDKLETSPKTMLAANYPITISNDKKTKSVDLNTVTKYSRISKKAHDHDCKIYSPFLTLDHSAGTRNYFVYNTAEVRFEMNALFAFGFDGYGYYTLETRPNNLAGETQRLGIFKDGEKTEWYDAVKTASDDAAFFDHVYMQFDWKGTFPLIGKNPSNALTNEKNGLSIYTETTPGYLPFKDTKLISDASTDQTALVGVFEDEAGNEAYEIMSYALPSSGVTSKIDLRLPSGINKARIYHNGSLKEADVSSGAFSISLPAGEAAFVIPYKA